MRGLLAAWRQTADRRARERAVVEATTGAEITFGDLAARAMAWREHHLGRHLRGASWPLSDPCDPCRRFSALISGPNSIAWLEVFLGLVEAGVVVVPVDPGEPPAAQAETATRLGARWRWDGLRLVELDGRHRYANPDVCLVKLTSGSTGVPRALPFTQAQMLADARNVCATMGIGSPDVNYGAIPFGHSYGLANLVIPLASRGVPVVCGSGVLPHAIATDFQRWRPTVFPGVPPIWRALAASTVEPAALRSLRLAISAGAPLPAEVERDFAARFRRKICSFYGSTETGGISFDASGRAAAEGHVGRPLKGVTIRPAPGGRIAICSAAVFTVGNRRRAGRRTPYPRQTLGCWVPPDRVELDPRGRVVLSGRRGSMVKIGGRRVNLQEVAARIRQVPGVRDAWVGAIGSPEPVLAAAVATSRPAATLRSALRVDTAPWKIPKKWLVVPELPVTPRGKLDGRALRAALGA